MPRFNSDVTSKKNKKNVHVEIVNKDFYRLEMSLKLIKLKLS